MSRRRREPPLSPAERAALAARERVLGIRRGVHMFHLLRERRGLLTLAQIQRMRRLLLDHADTLYRRAALVLNRRVPLNLPIATFN